MNNSVIDTETREDLDLIDLFKYLLKNWVIIALCTVLGIIASGIYTRYFINPLYASSSLVYIRGTSSTIESISDIQIGYYLSDDYEIIYKSRPVLEKVINDLDLKMSTGALSRCVEVSNDLGRNIIRIRAVTTDPNLSRDVVNKIVKYGTDVVKEINTKEPYIVEAAIANPNKVSPSLPRNMAIGAIAGFVFSALFFVILYLTNDRINSAEVIENKLNLPVIGALPISQSLAYDKEAHKRKKRIERGSKD